MNWILAATKLPLSTLLTIGGLGAMVIVWWSFNHWRAAVKLALVVALLEGAIRKWGFPQGQELVYFLKDVILAGAYIKFFFAPDLDLRTWGLRAPVAATLTLCSVLLIPTMNDNIGSALLGVYGLKLYVYYIPLAFMMPFLFRSQEEMVRQLTWYAMLAIPIGLLGVLQSRADSFSVLNTYADPLALVDTGATGFGHGEHVRITSTFSYITGHTIFVIFFGTLVLALLSLKETRKKWILLFICLPLIVGNGLMGGSRASLATLAFVFAGFVAASMSGRIGSHKNFLAVLIAGGLVSMVGGAYVFKDALFDYVTRSKTAGDSIAFRVYQMPVDAMSEGFQEAGLVGYGIGTTHPATEAMRRVLKIPAPRKKPPVFDTEMGQVLAELGLFGFLSWYGLRIVFIVAMWGAYLKCPPGPVKPFILAALLLSGPFMLLSVVLNHTANILFWAMTGLALIPLLEPKVKRMVKTRQVMRPRRSYS